MAVQAASRLNDDKYLHWLRSSLSLLYLKEGIASFCDEKGREFHNAIKDRVRLKSLFAVSTKCTRCTSENAKRAKTQDKKNTWRMDCRCNVCSIWLEETLPYHKNYPCPNIAWSNSDPKSWLTDAWELCKLFLPFGSEGQKGAGDSDCQALLIFMMDCKYFHTFLPNTQLPYDINQVRNACMHSNDMKVEEAEMRRRLGLMISLLEQPALATRPSCVEAKTKIIELRDNLLVVSLNKELDLKALNHKVAAVRSMPNLRDNLLDISLNKELELQALNHKIAAVRSDVDRLEAELQQLQTSLSDVTTRQDTTAEEYRQMCEHVRELGQNITEIKTSQEQHSQLLGNLDTQTVGKMADLTSRLQELETNSNKEIERLEGSFQSTLAGIETRLGNLETQRVAQQTDQPVDIKGLQCQLISLYKARRQHIPVYLLRSERKIRLEDLFVEQRLKVVDPDGRLKTDSTLSNSRPQAWSGIIHIRHDTPEDDKQQYVSSLKDVFYNKDNKCQYIYVSGNAGYGKSVFCSHLVRLWCKAHSESMTKLTPDEELMAEFPLLFCVDLKDAKYGGTVQTPDEICSLIQKQLQLSQLGLTDNDLSKLLQAEGQVLVVMDALDECKEERLPRGGLYNKCTTLVTSRPWKLEALRCDPECRADKELEIVGLKKGSSEDLSEKLVKLLNEKWHKSKNSEDFIEKMEEEGLEEFLNVPVLLTSMLCLWYDDIPFGQSQCEIYKTSIHHQILAAIKAKDIQDCTCPSETSFPICERERCPCQCYGELLWKVSKLACKALLGNVRERSLVIDHDQTILGLTDKEVDICMKLGILTQYKLLGNVTDYEPKKSVSFTHKTYQEWFAAIYLSSKLSVSELDNLLSEAISDLDSALELDQMFLFVCGLANTEVTAKLSKFIMSKVSSDARVQEHRSSNNAEHERSSAIYTSHDQLIMTIQDVVVAGVVEAKKNNRVHTALQLHDIRIVRYVNSGRFCIEKILACDTSYARSVVICSTGGRKMTPWPTSSCLEKLVLWNIADCLDNTFCDNFSAAQMEHLHLEYVRISHDQLKKLCTSLVSAGSLRTVNIKQLSCKTHKENRQDCSIMLDLSQHQGLEHLTLQEPGVGEVGGVSLCLNMDKLEKVELYKVTLTHDGLESLATAGNLSTMNIDKLTCITHQDSRQDCSIMLNLSQHQGLEQLTLRNPGVGKVRGVSLCPSLDKLKKVELYNVRLTHDGLASLCASLVTAGSLSTMNIDKLTCITHQDNRQDCSIMLNLSQHQGLEQLTLREPGVGKVLGVSLCPSMDKLKKVELYNVRLTHDGLASLCASLVTAGSLSTMNIDKLTCITHQDNRQDCSIHLDYSQYVSFQKIRKVWNQCPTIKITSWASSSCMETLDLHRVDISLCDTFCTNLDVGNVSNMYLKEVTLTHTQLESLCGSLATAGSLSTMNIDKLTCITHQGSRQDCSIMLNLSQHQGLEQLTLREPDVVWGVSLCPSMDKLKKVGLYNVRLTHDQLESLATAGSLSTLIISQLTCITHQDNRQDCSIHLDYSQYVSFQKMRKVWNQCPTIKITSWASSSCMETLDFHRVDISLCDTFCTNLDVGNVSNMYLEDVTLTHTQLESLCGSVATAGNLSTMNIDKLTCITHQDNRQDCSIMLNLSQHQGLKQLTLRDPGVREVSLCPSMDKLKKVELYNVRLTHDQLESLTSLATAGSLSTLNIDKLTCMETLDLHRVDISLCDTFCTNLDVGNVSNMYLKDVTLTHTQLESLCGSLATAGSLSAMNIHKLTCITHQDNRQDCSIMLDLSQHQGLEHISLRDLGVGKVRGVSLCQNMDKLEDVMLAGFCISAAALRQTLEALPGGHGVTVVLGCYDLQDSPLIVRGAKQARKLLKKLAPHKHVIDDDVEYRGDKCVVKQFRFYTPW